MFKVAITKPLGTRPPKKAADRKVAGKGPGPAAKRRRAKARPSAVESLDDYLSDELRSKTKRLMKYGLPKERPTVQSRLGDALQAWLATEKDLDARHRSFKAPLQAGAWKLLQQRVQDDGAEGRWSVVVIPPGKLDPVVFPERAPHLGCPFHELFRFGLTFRAASYWGSGEHCGAIEARLEKAWLVRKVLPPTPIDELLTALYMASYDRLINQSIPMAHTEGFVRALHAALVAALPPAEPALRGPSR